MKLEEIISAAVTSEIDKIVTGFIGRTCKEPGNYDTTRLERMVAQEIETIAREEVKKHSDTIRSAVIASLERTPVQFKITTYAEANIKAP